jgi:hypothetical protein
MDVFIIQYKSKKKRRITDLFTLGSCLRGNLRAYGFLIAAQAASKQPER